MRKILVLLSLAALASCSTDIDLYADYKQIPVIYGLLDARADTNFIKITRSFYTQGDAFQVAVNPDSSNYPGKLDVRLIEYCNSDSIREIILDTITKHNKEQGVFYAPDQKLYYTTERLRLNSASQHYSYRLKVVLPDTTLSTKAKIVGDNRFGIQSLAVNFSKAYIGKPPQKFRFHPATNAKFYEIEMKFTFKEQRTPDSDSVPRTMSWKVGTWTEQYFASSMEEDCYVFKYYPAAFYDKLTDFIGGDTAVVGLKRFINDFPIEVIITAGGEHLWRYVYTNNGSMGFVPGDATFTSIDDAQGVFSSRITTRSLVRLGGETVPDLVATTKYGFVFIGGTDK
ncbi:MAG: DUF4249 family protein [Bacteroidales bacterium]|nr:DUF4249 family protein [Bacteroidales bacterium]